MEQFTQKPLPGATAAGDTWAGAPSESPMQPAAVAAPAEAPLPLPPSGPTHGGAVPGSPQDGGVNLVKAALALRSLHVETGPRKQIAIYSMPKYLLWAQEALSRFAQRGKDSAATCALALGIARLRKVPGVKEICACRKEVVPRADPEAMDFFDRFGTVDIESGGTCLHSAPYKRHIRDDLAEELGRLAADLGLSQSLVAILALLIAHFDVKPFAKPEYRACMVRTLERFVASLARRVIRAREYARTVPEPTSQGEDPNYTLDDLLGRAAHVRSTPEEPQG